MTLKSIVLSSALLVAFFTAGCGNNSTTDSATGVNGSSNSLTDYACILPISVDGVQVGSMCEYTPDYPNTDCTANQGVAMNSCPAAPVLGCCTFTETLDGSVLTETVTNCFYYADAASISDPAKTLCQTGTWSSSLP